MPGRITTYDGVPEDPRRPRGAVFLAVAVAVLVLTQRLAVPVGGTQVGLSVPLLAGVVLYGVAWGHLVVSRTLALLVGLSLVALAGLTVLAEVRGTGPSVTSFILYVAIYVPAVVVAASPAAARYAIRFFVDLMLVAAVVGLVLFGAQYAGVPYVDYPSLVLPKQLLMEGFNTADPIRYASPIYRSNGVLFLEPSFFSLFLGLAAVVSVALRHRTLWLPVLLSAIVVTEAGNGIVLIAAAALWMLLAGPRLRLLALAPSLVVAAAFASLTPLAELFLSRSSEVGEQNSSASLRFVQPYTELLPQWVDSTATALFGSGAGSGQRLIIEQVGNAPVIVPAIPKLLVEYGLLGTLPALAFLLYLILGRLRWAPWAAGLLPIYLIVNASLLQVTLAATTYFFCSMLVPRAPTADQRSSETTEGTITIAPATANP